MITRKELLESKEFWMVKLQTALYENVEQYLKEHKLTKTDFAKKLGVSKGYVSQILNGDFDHKLSKFIEISLAIGKAPIINLESLAYCLELDALGDLERVAEPVPAKRIHISYASNNPQLKGLQAPALRRKIRTKNSSQKQRVRFTPSI
ncbi:helix-turn-helix transcriptional regulator [Pedobacter sp. MC2016-05]|uniref:helix-turn-helix transcriptional regulator n=1 Tax=Pedobacter sp. MC2016-05 TaxID=2994474 RepID=UPI0022472F22|nr:helix-turn-helix transcriptional regulator [Pedobacter sp. MC2016-05]MCX2477427.1 helix-turn-helix transcriptional regulator [Pedobacter sp. MC2016-05]